MKWGFGTAGSAQVAIWNKSPDAGALESDPFRCVSVCFGLLGWMVGGAGHPCWVSLSHRSLQGLQGPQDHRVLPWLLRHGHGQLPLSYSSALPWVSLCPHYPSCSLATQVTPDCDFCAGSQRAFPPQLISPQPLTPALPMQKLPLSLGCPHARGLLWSSGCLLLFFLVLGMNQGLPYGPWGALSTL